MGAFKEILIGVTDWVDNLRKLAEQDEAIAYSIHKTGLCDDKFVIVGGWVDGFNADQSDLLYISKADPTYAMCIKIVVNDGPWAYADFETLNMPVGEDSEVYDTCIALERDDTSEAVALFYLNELENIIKEFGNK